MKTLLKTVLAVAGAACIAGVAQANPVAAPAGYTQVDSMTDTLTVGTVTANPTSYTVLSQVFHDAAASAGSQYLYTYQISTTGPTVNLFDVDGITTTSFTVGGALQSATGFTGVYDGVSTVNWNTSSSSTLINMSGDVFELESALAPGIGGAGSADGANWNDNASVGVYVPVPPPVPDSGMTMTLLGGSLLGLGALRRKLGC